MRNARMPICCIASRFRNSNRHVHAIAGGHIVVILAIVSQFAALTIA